MIWILQKKVVLNCVQWQHCITLYLLCNCGYTFVVLLAVIENKNKGSCKTKSIETLHCFYLGISNNIMQNHSIFLTLSHVLLIPVCFPDSFLFPDYRQENDSCLFFMIFWKLNLVVATTIFFLWNNLPPKEILQKLFFLLPPNQLKLAESDTSIRIWRRYCLHNALEIRTRWQDDEVRMHTGKMARWWS